MDFKNNNINPIVEISKQDSNSDNTVSEKTTDKKKKISDMDNIEKTAYYNAEIERLKRKIKEAEEKRDKIGTVTEKQRNHALIQFGSHFISKEQLYDWYQLPPKERDKAIDNYAESIKKNAKSIE